MELAEVAYSAREAPNETRRFVHRRIIGAAVGFATGGFSGAVSGFATSGRSTRVTTVPVFANQAQAPPLIGRTEKVVKFGPFGVGGIERTTTSRFSIPQGTGTAVVEVVGGLVDRKARGPIAATADGCPKGFHLNKSGYNLKDGSRIEERTRCVRNRRRNNDNGQASMRAARRLLGRKSQQDKIDKALRAIAPKRSRRSAPKVISTGPHAHA